MSFLVREKKILSLLFILLFALLSFQLYRSFKFIKNSPKQNRDIQKLLQIMPQKDYKRVYADAHYLIEDISEIQSKQQKVFSYPCSFLDKYSFTYTFGVRVYPVQKDLKGFLITCKEDKELFQNLLEKKAHLLKTSEFFYLWRIL